MEEMQNQDAPKMSSVEEPQEEQELSHTDKLVGVFTEPSAMFEKTAKFPAKTIDWLLPVFIVIIISIAAQFALKTNGEIVRQQEELMTQQMEKQMDDAVKNGTLTREQADQRLQAMEDNRGAAGIFQTIGLLVGIPFVTFIIVFVVTGFFFALNKFALKGIAPYKNVMVAYGLPLYISAIEIILMTIAALAMSKLLTGISLADFLDIKKSTITGYLLGRVNPLTIWFYVVFGIGLAKMNKSDDVKKYVLVILAVWLIVTFLFFLIAKSVPFLSGFAG